MVFELKNITIREVVEGYHDEGENGITSMNGKLNIRPPYQREFIYKDKQRDAVIESIMNGFPLNTIWWAKTENGYEVMDGQQRTISFAQYFNGDFSINYKKFFNLTEEEKELFLNYELQVYICEGTDKEKLEWFKTINISGEKLTDQELRNSVYVGAWLEDAKRHFSKTNCPAYMIAKDYMNGTPIRQDYLETVLEWIVDRNNLANGTKFVVENYMADHQHDKDAEELWQYFDEVISWAKRIFPTYSKLMKGLNWGELYNRYHNNSYNSRDLYERYRGLVIDDDVTKKKGIFEYLLSGKEKYLSLRAFSEAMKISAYEKQEGICPICGEHFSIDKMQADHITPWSKGGKTIAENCQMLCEDCNRHKSDI